MLTITDNKALLRSGPPHFQSADKTIPPGTRIDVLETAASGGKMYVRVRNRDTGEALGWTLRSNAQDLREKFLAARANHVYYAGDHYLVVYLPANGIAPPDVDIFMFFHGIGGDYATTSTNKQNGGFADNTGISADLPGTVSEAERNVIAICVQANNKDSPEWSAITPDQYKGMADAVLAYLRVDMNLSVPLRPATVSLAGHSAGGMALGPAALGLDAQDVTLLDAGYGYGTYQSSWNQLREWFVTGKPVKQLRIVSKDTRKTGSTIENANTRHVQYVELSQGTLTTLANARATGTVVCRTAGPDETTGREADMTLDGGFDLLVDGALQGSLRVFAIDPEASGSKAHWGVKDEAMLAAISAGPVSDEFGASA